MAKNILICGYGPGISRALAQRFGAEGFAVALSARTAEKVTAGVKALEAKGIRAAGFPADLSDPAAARALVGKAREALGPIGVVAWVAYANGAGDLLAADPPAIRGVLDVAIVGLLGVVQAALPDLKKQPDAAILIVNGGLGYTDPGMDSAAVLSGTMGLAVANAAKHKLAGLLSQKLKSDGIYVGEAMVLGTIKETAFDAGNATIHGSAVADKLWDLYRARTEVTGRIG
ncbi:MAG TPA: SDR family NAD(P)-dependent oxidoreductase [Polyangia bacterium]|nr:SDR family NAD(P)-dependent oxidoreductase [Polyangia bacterium]